MITEWTQLLDKAGAEYDGDSLLHFGNAERERRAALGGNVMCELSQYRLLAVQGSQNREFLQGQLTSDLELLSPERSQLSGFCTPKGRLIASMRLFQNGDTIFTILRDDIAASTLSQLQAFVVNADVQMGDTSSALVQLGISGEQAESLLAEHLGSLPGDINAVLQHERYIVIKVAAHRYHVLGAVTDMISLWQLLDVHCSASAGSNWELLNIRDGIPEITAATSDTFVPQMINLDLLDAVSYTKGCYTGQEIVARTHYLGKQKRRMFRMHIRSDTAPRPGDELTTASSGSNQFTGTLVNVQADAVDGYEALAVLALSKAEETLALKAAESVIELEPLPYSLDQSV